MSRPSIYAVKYGSQRTSRQHFYLSWPNYDQADSPLEMAYYFWVIRDSDDRVVVVDTGFAEAEAQRRGRTMECTPASALREMDIDPASVSTVVITHLHYDHAGNLDLFPNAEFVLAQREFDFWTSNPLAARRLFAQHADRYAVRLLCRAQGDGRVRLIDDAAADLTSEIRLLRVGGHTPGQLVVDITAADRRVVLASDAVHYYEELAEDRPPSVLTNLAEYYAGFDTLTELAAAGASVVPGHDPAILQEYPRLDLGVPIAQLG